MENLASTSLTYEIIRCSVICTSLTTWIPRMSLPSPSKQCWDDEKRSGQAKVYRAAQTATLLGGRGKEEKLIHSVLIVPRVFSPIV